LGRDQLIAQMPTLRVSADCSSCGSLEFANVGQNPQIEQRIPVEAVGFDEDGAPIHLLLHVVDGAISSLEVYREDGTEVGRMPDSETLRLETN
jgi:hypothetical protein